MGALIGTLMGQLLEPRTGSGGPNETLAFQKLQHSYNHIVRMLRKDIAGRWSLMGRGRL